VFQIQLQYTVLQLYLKYKQQNTSMYYKYVFQIHVLKYCKHWIWFSTNTVVINVRYLAEFVRSKSSPLGVGRGPPKLGTLSPAPLGWGRGSVGLPMISY